MEPDSDNPLYCHVILNLNFSYFATVGRGLPKINVAVCSVHMFGLWHTAFGICAL